MNTIRRTIQAEIERRIEAFEVKAGKKVPSAPRAFVGAYPDAPFHYINRDNYLDFVL